MSCCLLSPVLWRMESGLIFASQPAHLIELVRCCNLTATSLWAQRLTRDLGGSGHYWSVIVKHLQKTAPVLINERLSGGNSPPPRSQNLSQRVSFVIWHAQDRSNSNLKKLLNIYSIDRAAWYFRWMNIAQRCSGTSCRYVNYSLCTANGELLFDTEINVDSNAET